MAFSAQATQAIADFAGSLGIQATPARDGSYSFVFARTGTLTFTAAADGSRTLLSLEARPSRLSEDVEARLLALAGPDPTTSRFLSTGLTRDGSAMFAVSVADEEIGLPTLETCLQQLMTARASVN